MMIGGLICCLGVILLVSDSYKTQGAATFLAGLAWYLIARARAWWNNG